MRKIENKILLVTTAAAIAYYLNKNDNLEGINNSKGNSDIRGEKNNSIKISIIGAGISGISLAIKCEKKNIKYTIYEMNDFIGGLWNKNMGIVNEYSNIQIISPGYKFEDDNSFYSQYTGSNELYNKIEENCNKYDIKKNIKFNTKVLNFESLSDNKVKLELFNTLSQTYETVITDALYIRTGTLNKVRELVLPCEDKFTGIVDYGTNSGKDDINFQDKVVTIIGFGATAFENIKNAFKKGAKKVIVLARNLKNIWTRKMAYEVVRELISPAHYLHSSFRRSSWERINNYYNIAYNHFQNNITDQIKNVSFDENMNHNMSKIPAVTEDILIYLHYGLLEIYNDEIQEINNKNIITKKGNNIETDIIFKCTGYQLDEGIFAGHKLNNTIFVDNKHNITHNCGFDRSGKYKYFLGPTTDVNILPTLSYPILNHVFDELSLYFLQYPGRYHIFCRNTTFDEIISNKSIEDIEMKCYIYFFWKLISYLKTSLLDLKLTYRLSIHFWNIRSDVLNNLDRKQFRIIDKNLWDETSKFCHQRNPEIEYLEYPY